MRTARLQYASLAGLLLTFTVVVNVCDRGFRTTLSQLRDQMKVPEHGNTEDRPSRAGSAHGRRRLTDRPTTRRQRHGSRSWYVRLEPYTCGNTDGSDDETNTNEFPLAHVLTFSACQAVTFSRRVERQSPT